MTSSHRWLTEVESSKLLKGYGIPFLPSAIVQSPEEARQWAARWTEPFVLKVVSKEIRHKSDVGGVMLGVRAMDVERAYEALLQRVSSRAADQAIDGVLLQPQARAGTELMIGVKRDPAFGHVVLCGAGGVLTELLDDVSLRLLPVDRKIAQEMLSETRVARLLDGVRGGPPGDREAVVDILTQLSTVVQEHADICELDLNPVVVHEVGATAVDALIKLGSVQSAA